MARTYTPEQKAEALAIYTEEGVAEAARRTGIPPGTIACWVHRTTAQTLHRTNNAAATRQAVERRKRSLEERRVVLVELLGQVAELGVERILAAFEAEEAPKLRDLVDATGRAIHDLQLLSGGATARGEHRELATRDDVRKLRDDLAERRAKRAAGQ